jgi:RNA polymerase sigma factor (sigma-70 family)
VLTVTDEALMIAVRDGDLAKLGLLFERHHVALFDFLSRMTGDRTAAEDLVQDIFVRILKYRGTYRSTGGSFETWLFRIARNARADYFRTRQPLEPLAAEALERPEPGPGPMRRLEADCERARLKQALLQLREDKRELIVLARYRGMTHEQIAELLGIETGAVKVRIHRALRELRDVFLQLTDGNRSCNAKKSTRTLQII